MEKREFKSEQRNPSRLNHTRLAFLNRDQSLPGREEPSFFDRFVFSPGSVARSPILRAGAMSERTDRNE
jgi:hypothetical protein